jgi:poly(3-hydroxybutyrate) depolymerase
MPRLLKLHALGGLLKPVFSLRGALTARRSPLITRTALGIAVVLVLVFGVIAACVGSSATLDARIKFGAGAAYVHVPHSHSRIGVVVLHSLGNDQHELVKQGWSRLSDHERFVAIYPQLGESWNAGLCCGPSVVSKRDDVTWLATVIADLRVRYGLTTIYLAGNSNGAMMAERLVAERPQNTRRVAIWAGAPEMPRAGRWTGSIAIYDGSRDPLVPLAGGTTYISGVHVTIRPARTTGQWLIGAHVKTVSVKGAGHTAAPGWPAMAWRELAR